MVFRDNVKLVLKKKKTGESLILWAKQPARDSGGHNDDLSEMEIHNGKMWKWQNESKWENSHYFQCDRINQATRSTKVEI